MTIEEFNIWAYKWVGNFDSRDRLSSEEDRLHRYLIELLVIDLETEKGVYFHQNSEIKDWIQKINNNELI